MVLLNVHTLRAPRDECVHCVLCLLYLRVGLSTTWFSPISSSASSKTKQNCFSWCLQVCPKPRAALSLLHSSFLLLYWLSCTYIYCLQTLLTRSLLLFLAVIFSFLFICYFTLFIKSLSHHVIRCENASAAACRTQAHHWKEVRCDMT